MEYIGTATQAPTAAPTPAGILGDANGDGSINIVDALIIAQCYVGITSCPSISVADANCGGGVDIVDVLLIAQLYADLIAGFC